MLRVNGPRTCAGNGSHLVANDPHGLRVVPALAQGVAVHPFVGALALQYGILVARAREVEAEDVGRPERHGAAQGVSVGRAEREQSNRPNSGPQNEIGPQA